MKKLLFLLPLSLFAKVGYFEPWGKDADIEKNPKEKQVKKQSVIAKSADAIIKFHQQNISPISGPRSNFRPTSSKYMENAIKEYGFFQGFVMGCDRLLRENADPWVFRTITIDGIIYKYDPVKKD